MDVFTGHKITGVPVKSGPKWVLVFPNFDADVMFESAKHEIKAGPDWKLVRPISWDAFPDLKKHGGAHVSLAGKPDVAAKDPCIGLTIVGSATWLEKPYESGISGDVTKGFVVMLLKPDAAHKHLPFDEPCHMSIAQFIHK